MAEYGRGVFPGMSEFNHRMACYKSMQSVIISLVVLFFPSAAFAFVPHGYPGIFGHLLGHLGTVSVESESGKGTHFFLSFPVRWKEH